ncbi:MAG: TRAP transporter small permease subunit, partial [Candidatus Eremiobacteraeota bacterium]|nr:TRAP transporter small permease subunit [Candidatus Eremiobacteraeota bacterium]
MAEIAATSELAAVRAAGEAEGGKAFVYRRAGAATVDRVIGWLSEPLAAFLVIVEIVILGAGVFTRYVLRSPLVWTDELATTLLLWLAMLGSVAAYRRNEHIRLSALLRRVGAKAAARLETISSVVVVLFVVILIGPTFAFFQQETVDLTPAMSIPVSYSVLAIIAGLLMILILALLRLSESDPKTVV